MTLAYTLATAAPQVPVLVSVPDAQTAAEVINETVKWAKASGIQVVDWTFTIAL